MKDLLLKMAQKSCKNRFRLLAAMNPHPTQWVFMWCDEEQNFIGMCIENLDKYKVDYSLWELEKVVDKELITYANALLANGVRSGYSHVPDKGWARIKSIYKKLGVEEEHLGKV